MSDVSRGCPFVCLATTWPTHVPFHVGQGSEFGPGHRVMHCVRRMIAGRAAVDSLLSASLVCKVRNVQSASILSSEFAVLTWPSSLMDIQ